jgi:hypothetical protein
VRLCGRLRMRELGQDCLVPPNAGSELPLSASVVNRITH